MDDPEASSSQYYRESQSIHIPESPGSPNLLEPDSPVLESAGRTVGPEEVAQDPRIQEELLQQDSETYTQRIDIIDNEQNRAGNLILPADSIDVISEGNSNDSAQIYDPENSNSSVTTLAPWHGTSRLGITDSSTSQHGNDDTTNSRITNYYNEESNSLMSLPEAPKEKECEEPPAKVRRVSSPKNHDEGDGESCPICLESWGTSGDHRLVALKCGHLFGSKCVERWLKAQVAKERSCPTCKSKANMKDVRFIYARRLVAADTSEITGLQKQIELLQAEKSRTELELQKSKIAQRACIQQLEALRNALMKSQVTKERTIRRTWRFALEKNLEICKDGGCRVSTYNCRTYELYVSQKSTNNLFPGYGIRKVSCVDYKLGQFVHLHTKPIRDITYSQPRDLLLSVGLDSSARIVERGIPSTTVQALIPLYSCSWDYLRSNEFYVGGVGGQIHQYDVRNPNSYIQRLTAPGDMSPVVSLCSTEYGLLSCHLNSCWLWVANNLGQWEPRSLPVEGPFMSLSYDSESHQALVSCRPGSTGVDRSRLTLCRFKNNFPNGEVTCEVGQTFSGSAKSSLMSRSTWVRCPGASWIAAHSESEATLVLHGLDGSRTMCLPAAEPALDICSVQLNGDTVLAALSESRLRLYKAVPTNS